MKAKSFDICQKRIFDKDKSRMRNNAILKRNIYFLFLVFCPETKEAKVQGLETPAKKFLLNLKSPT